MNKLIKMISVLATLAFPVWAIAAGDHDAHGTGCATSAQVSGVPA